jgi:hypothetical protein
VCSSDLTPIFVEDDQAGEESSYSHTPLVTPGGIALSDSEEAEALADSLEAPFRPVTAHTVPAFIEMVDVPLESYFVTPASEPNLTDPEEIHEAIRGLKLRKAPSPNGIPNRALKHYPTFLSLSSTWSYAPITFLQYGSTLE